MGMDEMKQAVLIMWHRNGRNLKRLIESFNEWFDIFIHIDRKSEMPIWLDEMCVELKNIHVISKVKVNWGGLSIVMAELELIKEALAYGEYSYIHIISGEDVVLASPEQFREHLSGQRKQYLEYYSLPTPKWNNGGLDRLSYFWPMDTPVINRYLTHTVLKWFVDLQRWVSIYRRLPIEIGILYGGSNWMSITGECAKWIVTDDMPRKLLKRLHHTFAPDEIFFQTAILNSPFADEVVNNSLRYIDWGKGGASPASLTELHLKAALQSGCLFARKVTEGVSDGFIVGMDRMGRMEDDTDGVFKPGTTLPPSEPTDVYFITCHEDRYNGVDTYHALIEEIFSDRNRFTLTDLIFSAPESMVSIRRGVRIVRIALPPKEGMTYISGLGIIDSGRRNLFLQNFCPASPTICSAKRNFPKARIIYVIHDFMWMSYFMGEYEAYIDFIRGERDLPKHLEKSATMMRALFHDTRKAADAADAVICHNSDTLSLLIDFFGIRKDYVNMIPMGLAPLRDRNKRWYEGKRFIFIGRPTPQKGFDTLVEAATMLEDHDPEARIIVAGDSSLFRGRVPGNMIMVGAIPRSQVLELISDVDFGIVPSRYEQFGLAGLEMMRAGLPVIASDSFGVRKMFNSGNAMIFHAGDSRQLLDRMKEALAMKSKDRKKWSARALKDFESRFRIEIMKKQYMRLTDNLFNILKTEEDTE